jgi:MscS family membrane protein
MVVFRILKLICILAVGWFLVRVLDVTAALLMEIFSNREDEVGLSMVPIARKIFRPLLIALVVVLALQNVGLNVTGLLAGLGIGGLALAMASKSTVENMLGGITIAFDRPFKVGDTISVGSTKGTVEEVGLRSTRIRTLDRTVVTIPNGSVADSNVENWARRDRLRHTFAIGLTYDTTLDQMRLVIDELKRYLHRREDVAEGFAVRFGAFGDSSMNIDVAFYVETTAWGEFTAAREEILMAVADIVSKAGADFAFPSQTLYNAEAGKPDPAKADAASQVVRERIAAGTLCIPEIPDAVAEELAEDLATEG